VIKPCAVVISPLPRKEEDESTASVVTFKVTITHGNAVPQDCPYCGVHYPSKISLSRHIKMTHQNVKTYYCNVCSLYFKTEEQELIHRKETHQSSYQCIVCRTNCKSRYILRLHIQEKHANEVFICKYNFRCVKYFMSEEERNAHVAKVHESQSNSMQCIYCKKFICKKGFAAHMKIFHNSVAIRCEYSRLCCAYFRSEEERSKHYDEVHEGFTKNRVRCNICKILVRASNYSKHLIIRHKVNTKIPKKEKCPYCETLVLDCLMEQHVNQNHKSIVIKCSFNCGKFFVNEQERQEHILKFHSTNRNVKTKCFYCGKMVKRYPEHIQCKHSKIAIRCNYPRCVTYFHSQEKKMHFEERHLQLEELKQFHCSKCAFKCSAGNNFRRHVKAMHGGVETQCNLCGNIYKSELRLRDHILNIHSNKQVVLEKRC
jgi:hypothetical protein